MTESKAKTENDQLYDETVKLFIAILRKNNLPLPTSNKRAYMGIVFYFDSADDARAVCEFIDTYRKKSILERHASFMAVPSITLDYLQQANTFLNRINIGNIKAEQEESRKKRDGVAAEAKAKETKAEVKAAPAEEVKFDKASDNRCLQTVVAKTLSSVMRHLILWNQGDPYDYRKLIEDFSNQANAGFCYSFAMIFSAMFAISKEQWWESVLDEIIKLGIWLDHHPNYTNEEIAAYLDVEVPLPQETQRTTRRNLVERAINYILENYADFFGIKGSEFKHVSDQSKYLSNVPVTFDDKGDIVDAKGEVVSGLEVSHSDHVTKPLLSGKSKVYVDHLNRFLQDLAEIISYGGVCVLYGKAHATSLSFNKKTNKWIFYNSADPINTHTYEFDNNEEGRSALIQKIFSVYQTPWLNFIYAVMPVSQSRDEKETPEDIIMALKAIRDKFKTFVAQTDGDFKYDLNAWKVNLFYCPDDAGKLIKAIDTKLDANNPLDADEIETLLGFMIFSAWRSNDRDLQTLLLNHCKFNPKLLTLILTTAFVQKNFDTIIFDLFEILKNNKRDLDELVRIFNDDFFFDYVKAKPMLLLPQIFQFEFLINLPKLKKLLIETVSENISGAFSVNRAISSALIRSRLSREVLLDLFKDSPETYLYLIRSAIIRKNPHERDFILSLFMDSLKQGASLDCLNNLLQIVPELNSSSDNIRAFAAELLSLKANFIRGESKAATPEKCKIITAALDALHDALNAEEKKSAALSA